jgi:1-aminocyclopropane-1-carboxylate deaminase/D-cysteine desulfhydrase-like pyridoxal-dependent ACC family enzyme
MTAAAGARLGLEVHLILSGDRPGGVSGNQLLSVLFGAQLHFTGADETDWGVLEIERESLTEQLAAEGLRPYAIPIGGSTAVGALGYAVAFTEMLDQFDEIGISPSHVVFTSSSGGTHAGLLAGRAAAAHTGRNVPDVIAVGVAKGVNIGRPDVAELANETLAIMGSTAIVAHEDVEVDARWMGDDYAVPTAAGDEAIRWAARHGGWLMDRTYSGKGCAGLLGLAAEGRFTHPDAAGAHPSGDVVFVHTGGWPALFAPGGAPGVRGGVTVQGDRAG